MRQWYEVTPSHAARVGLGRFFRAVVDGAETEDVRHTDHVPDSEPAYLRRFLPQEGDGEVSLTVSDFTPCASTAATGIVAELCGTVRTC